MGDWSAFESRARDIASYLKARDRFALVYNYDADGISTGAIIANALARAGKSFVSLPLKQLYESEVDSLQAMDAEHFVFLDFGSGQLDWLPNHFSSFCVVDHHQPVPSGFPLHLNPLSFGFDGGTELSAAGTAYFVARAMSPQNRDLAAQAIVGAVGDMQDLANRALVGLNRTVLDDAVSAGALSVHTDLRLFGRVGRPLTQFLTFASQPSIPGVTGSEEGSRAFLESLGIPLQEGGAWRTYEALSQEEKRKLFTALVLRLSEFGAPEWKIRSLQGEVYTLVREAPGELVRDAKEFATLLNACGRHKMGEIGLHVARGDRAAHYERAHALLAAHRRQLAEGIRLVEREGLDERPAFYFFDARDRINEGVLGIVAGMLYGGVLPDAKKPIVFFGAAGEGKVKASARATGELVRAGVNLGACFKQIAAELGEGAEGGGHKIAAGIHVDVSQKEEVLAGLEARLLPVVQSVSR